MYVGKSNKKNLTEITTYMYKIYTSDYPTNLRCVHIIGINICKG